MVSSSPRIVCVAIKTADGRVWSAPRPARHDAVILKIAESTGMPVRNEIQGFLDDSGNFLTRDEAEPVARAAGQVSGSLIGGPLTSEDLWSTWRCGYDPDKNARDGGCGLVYEIPRRSRPRRGQRINPRRTTTCPSCGRVDNLYKKV